MSAREAREHAAAAIEGATADGGRARRGEDERWVVRFERPRAEVVLDDRTGRVLERWEGFRADWVMARGYPGAFGGPVVNHPLTWVILGALFLAPFAPRPPPELLAVLALAIPYALFAAGEVELSVPLTVPPLLLLLVLALARPSRPRRPGLGPRVLGTLLLALLAARAAVALGSGTVIDVGYSGVIGADRLGSGAPLYGAFPVDNEHGDTYGPALYLAYLPFELALPWSGGWDTLPAARAAALGFDLLAVGALWRAGGVLAAYLWAACPFTLLVLASGANDALVGALVALALLAPPAGRGAALAFAGLAKFAPLALAPLLLRSRTAVAVAALVAGGLLLLPGDLGFAWERTLGYQADRDSPFSVWGLWDLGALQLAALAAAAALALAAPRIPRPLPALALAVLVALELALGHWFFSYVLWFAPALFIGLSTGSIASARPSAAPRTSTALSHGSTSEAS